MSEIQNNNIPLIKITAPELNQSGYAANLSSTFDNIDKNFATLANYDFIKGESGRSISIVEMPFYDDNKELNDYGELVKSYFDNKYDEEKMSINGHDLFDNFTSDNAGTLHLIVERNNNTTNDYTVISSYYYIFLDGRFANDEVGSIDDKSVFEDVEDLSCILIYDKDIEGFKSLDNAFPTMYYEKGVGLCWKINGTNTGIAVQGIPGKDGKNAILQYVECTNSTPVNGNESYRKAEVSRIYNYPNFTAIDVNTSKNDLSELNGNSSLILIIGDEDNKGNKLHHMYFGQLIFEDDKKLYAYYFESTELTKSVDNAVMINILKSISFNSRDYSPLRGLFIPISNANEVNNTQPVHLITATDILGEFENEVSGVNADLTLTPINDINTLNPDGYENKLLVEKYLYVDVDSSYYDGVLEYKLVAAHDDNNDLNEFAEYGDGLTSDNTKYLDSIFRGDYSDEIIDSIPKDFRTATKYRWELITDNVSDDINTYFKYIFTTTITPNVSSEIMWFDGIEGEFDDTENKYLIYGWSGNIENVIRFKKLTPVFVNSFKYDGDTSLNVNYNVNITGNNDKGNAKTKNLNVNGDVISKNVVTETLYADNIDNIRTTGNIVADGELKACKNNNKYLMELSKDGLNINTDIETQNIEATGVIESKVLHVKNDNNKNLLNVKTNNIYISSLTDKVPGLNPPIFDNDFDDDIVSRAYSVRNSNEQENNQDILARKITGVAKIDINNLFDMKISKYKDNEDDNLSIDNMPEIHNDVAIVNENANTIITNSTTNFDSIKYLPTINDVIGKMSFIGTSAEQTKYIKFSDKNGFVSTSNDLRNTLTLSSDDLKSHNKRGKKTNDIAKYIIEIPKNITNIYTDITEIGLPNFGFIIKTNSDIANTDNNLLRLDIDHDDTYLKITTKYKIDENEIGQLSLSEIKFTGCTKIWHGVDSNANKISSKTWLDRYQAYMFYPKIEDFNTIINDISSYLNNYNEQHDHKDHTVEIIVSAEVSVYFKSSGSDHIKSIHISDIMPIAITGEDISINKKLKGDPNKIVEIYDFDTVKPQNIKYYLDGDNGIRHMLNFNGINNYDDPCIAYTLKLDFSKSNAGYGVITNDGIMFRHANTLFGIGVFSGIPKLFFKELKSNNVSMLSCSVSDIIAMVNNPVNTQEATVQTEEPENTELPELPE